MVSAKKPKWTPKKMPFSLNELVLAKFEEYPQWPAIIKKCFWTEEKFNGQWALTARGRRPAQVWCYFINDDSANWVKCIDVKSFSPSIKVTDLVAEDHASFEDLKKALRMATDIYEKKQRGIDDSATEDEDEEGATEQGTTGTKQTEVTKTRGSSQQGTTQPAMASDAGQCANDVGGSGEKAANESPKTPVRARKRPLDETDSDATSPREKKKKGKVHPTNGPTADRFKPPTREQLEEEGASLRSQLWAKEEKLRSAEKIIRKLQKTVSERDALIQEYKTSPSKGLVDIPSFPHTEMPKEAEFQSKDAKAEEFEKMMETLQSAFVSFSSNIRKSVSLRRSLDNRIAEVREEMAGPIDKIAKQEKLAVEDEVQIIGILSEIVISKVPMSDLIRSRAGKFVSRVRKSCEQMPQIRYLSSKIHEIWKDQVDVDTDEIDNRADGTTKESPQGSGKSSG